MFSSPLLSARNQNEIFVFVRVFSTLRERKAPRFGSPSLARPRQTKSSASCPVRATKLYAGTPWNFGWRLRARRITSWAPALKDTNAAPREATPQRAYRGKGYAKSIARGRSRGAFARAFAPRRSGFTRRASRVIHTKGGDSVARGSMRRRNAPTETVKSPSRVWRVVGSAINLVAGGVPFAEGPAHLLLKSSEGGREMVMVS
jgi:hypothetical protein